MAGAGCPPSRWPRYPEQRKLSDLPAGVVWLFATPFQREFSLVTFFYTVLAFVSLYVLFALLKGELFPTGALFGGATPHPSLLGTLFQSFQTPDPQAAFRESWYVWIHLDLLLLAAGLIATFLNLLAGIVNRFQVLATLFTITVAFFLLISSAIYGFVITPLLPFLALNIALVLHSVLRWLARCMRADLVRALLLFLLIGLLVPAGFQQAWPLTTQNQTATEQEALWWVLDNVSPRAVVITNSYLYTDLHDPQGAGIPGEAPFTQTQIYSNAALDPAIASEDLKQDWRRIDVLVIDPTMLQSIRFDPRYMLLNQALHHAILWATFGTGTDGGIPTKV